MQRVKSMLYYKHERFGRETTKEDEKDRQDACIWLRPWVDLSLS